MERDEKHRQLANKITWNHVSWTNAHCSLTDIMATPLTSPVSSLDLETLYEGRRSSVSTPLPGSSRSNYLDKERLRKRRSSSSSSSRPGSKWGARISKTVSSSLDEKEDLTLYHGIHRVTRYPLLRRIKQVLTVHQTYARLHAHVFRSCLPSSTPIQNNKFIIVQAALLTEWKVEYKTHS